jgi:hypothetical protein
VSIKDRAENPSSTLRRFLDDTLLRRGLVADDWARQAEKGTLVRDGRGRRSPAAWPLRRDTDRAGISRSPATGICCHACLGKTSALLHGAGCTEARYKHVADTGTRDPLLLEWVRSSHPIALSSAQHKALAACWDAVLARDLVQTLGNSSVETALLLPRPPTGSPGRQQQGRYRPRVRCVPYSWTI